MRPLTQLLPPPVFDVGPVFDEIVREDTASGEEAAVGVQCFQGTCLRACPVGILFPSSASICSSKPFHNAYLDGAEVGSGMARACCVH